MADEPPSTTERVELLNERIAELEAENERLRKSRQNRRRFLRGGVSLGVLSLLAGTGSAAPEGEVSGTPSEPLAAIETDRINFEARSSGLSDPDDGTLTYRGDL